VNKRIGMLLVLVVAGCPRQQSVEDAGPPPGTPRAVIEVEPNDDAAHAQVLEGAVDVTASLHAAAGKKGDEDWFELRIPAGQRATVTVDPAPPLDVALEIVDADGVKRLSLDGAQGGGSEVLHGLASGRMARLRVFSKKADASGPYHLTVTLEPDDGALELEPNNRAADATPLPPEHPLKGYLPDPLDEDWYRLTLPGPEDAGAPATVDAGTVLVDAGDATDAGLDGGGDGGALLDAGGLPPAPVEPPTLLHLTVSGVAGVRLEVALVNAAQATIFSARGKAPGDAVEIRNLALRAGEREFFVVVRSAAIGVGKEARRGASGTESYTVTAQVEVAKGAVELEPNDDPAHATPIGPGGSIEGYLSPRGDVDVFMIHSDTPVSARAELSGVEHLDLELSVLGVSDGGKESVLLTANDGELKEPEVLTNLAFGPGELYFQVRSAGHKGPDGKWTRDGENAKDPYRLNVVLSPDDASREREPNNAPELATPIALGQTLRGTIHPRRDVDFYRLDLSAQPVKVNLKATATGILKVDIALYLYRQKPDGSLGLVQTSDTGKGDAPESVTFAAEPGVYFLKVKDTHDRASNFLDSYSLHVEAP
jgi:hypothetical protein